MHLMHQMNPKDRRKRIERRGTKERGLQNEIHQPKTNANATLKKDNSRPRKKKR
jgi:hypothetical protein